MNFHRGLLVFIVAVCVLVLPQAADAKKLLKLAAAAAIIRGGPIIPVPIRYPVQAPAAGPAIIADGGFGGFGGGFGDGGFGGF